MLLVSVREDPRRQQTSCTVAQSGDFDIYEGRRRVPSPSSVKGLFLEWRSARQRPCSPW